MAGSSRCTRWMSPSRLRVRAARSRPLPADSCSTLASSAQRMEGGHQRVQGREHVRAVAELATHVEPRLDGGTELLELLLLNVGDPNQVFAPLLTAGWWHPHGGAEPPPAPPNAHWPRAPGRCCRGLRGLFRRPRVGGSSRRAPDSCSPSSAARRAASPRIDRLTAAACSSFASRSRTARRSSERPADASISLSEWAAEREVDSSASSLSSTRP